MNQHTLITNQERSAQQQLAAAETLAQEINEAYESYMGSTQEIYSLALTMENRRIRLGTLLHTAKGTVGHGKFQRWIEDATQVPYRSAAHYMACAKQAKYQELANLDGLREYHKLLIRCGLKEAPEGHGIQTLHFFNPFAQFTKAVSKTRETITSIFERRPLDQWEVSEREQLKAQLEPLHNLYNQL